MFESKAEYPYNSRLVLTSALAYFGYLLTVVLNMPFTAIIMWREIQNLQSTFPQGSPELIGGVIGGVIGGTIGLLFTLAITIVPGILIFRLYKGSTRNKIVPLIVSIAFICIMLLGWSFSVIAMLIMFINGLPVSSVFFPHGIVSVLSGIIGFFGTLAAIVAPVSFIIWCIKPRGQ